MAVRPGSLAARIIASADVAVPAQRAIIAAQDSRSSRSAAMAVSSLRHKATQSSANLSAMPHFIPEDPAVGWSYRETRGIRHTCIYLFRFAPHNNMCDL
jgi:hypothetical protein